MSPFNQQRSPDQVGQQGIFRGIAVSIVYMLIHLSTFTGQDCRSVQSRGKAAHQTPFDEFDQQEVDGGHADKEQEVERR